MARQLIRAKGRRERGAFIALPCDVLACPNFAALSAKAVKLLMDILVQIRMKSGGPINNGDLAVTLSMMRERGWTSKRSLYEARDELVHYGFIVLTRQGGRHRASLYAITWWAINGCNGKLDVCETNAPPGGWKELKAPFAPGEKLKSLPPLWAQCAPTMGPKRKEIAESAS